MKFFPFWSKDTPTLDPTWICLTCILGGFLWPLNLSAQSKSPIPGQAEVGDATPSSLSEAEIEDLIEQLNADEFTTREAATKALGDGGRAVIPAMEQNAESPELEVSSRCFAVLKAIYEGTDIEARADAALALKRLCSSSQAAVARRAKSLLTPPAANLLPGGVPIPGFRLPPGLRFNVQRNLQAGGRTRSVATTNVNGRVTVEAAEGSRRVLITHQNEREIRVRVTEPAPDGGEPRVTESVAANRQELKEKYPEAFKLFTEYAGQELEPDHNPSRIFPPGSPPGVLPGLEPLPQVPAPPGPPGFPPPRVNGRPLDRGRRADNAGQRESRSVSIKPLAELEKRLESIVSQLRREAESDRPQTNELQRLAGELDEVRAALADLMRGSP